MKYYIRTTPMSESHKASVYKAREMTGKRVKSADDVMVTICNPQAHGFTLELDE